MVGLLRSGRACARPGVGQRLPGRAVFPSSHRVVHHPARRGGLLGVWRRRRRHVALNRRDEEQREEGCEVAAEHRFTDPRRVARHPPEATARRRAVVVLSSSRAPPARGPRRAPAARGHCPLSSCRAVESRRVVASSRRASAARGHCPSSTVARPSLKNDSRLWQKLISPPLRNQSFKNRCRRAGETRRKKIIYGAYAVSPAALPTGPSNNLR